MPLTRHTIRSADDLRAIELQSPTTYMPHAHVYDALCEVADRYPDRPALTFLPDADPRTAPRRWTYRALLADIRRTANLFHALVPDEQPRIAMLLPAIPEAHLTLWGGETAGVVCPINYLLDAAHIAQLVDAARCNILVALGPHPDLDIWSRVPALAAACPGLRHILCVGEAAGFQGMDAAVQAMPGDLLTNAVSRDSGQLAALFHTGGTTGAPKLAQHAHGNQLHAAWGAAQMYAMTERDVILNGFPLFHVAGAFVFGLSALLSGAEVVLPTLLGMRNGAFVERYWDFVRKHDVSLLAAVPTVIATLLGVAPGQASLASVRALLTGGSPLPAELANAFEQTYQVPVRNILGMTECAGVVSIEPFLSARTPGSCGIPLPFTEVKAVRADGSDCAPGESGVLRLRGPNVGPGYTEADRNAGTFTDDGWLISGDIGHVDEQRRIFVTGRAKDVIIRSSHNIDPQMIEEALLQHPDVTMAAAVGEPDEYAGELPVAFVSLRAGADVDEQALLSFASERIAERPACPKRITLLPAIPVTAVGKVYKPRLRGLAHEHALSERLARAGLRDQVGVAVEESPRGLCARFAVRDGVDIDVDFDVEACRHAIAELMSPFAIAYEIAEPASIAADAPPPEAS